MKVLVAVDEKEFACAITEFIVSQGWPQNTQFTILSVIEPLKVGNLMAVLPGPILDEIVEDHFDSAKVLVKATASAIRQHCPDSEILEEIIEGFAKEEIIRYAEEQKANLIIVGSHGRSGFQRMILGSVSLAVVSHAPCSVVVVRLPNAAQDDSTHDESRSENKADVAMKS